MSGLLKNERTGPTLVYEVGFPLKSTAFTTNELRESAGAPIFIDFFSVPLGRFVPATIKITSYSLWILSNSAASGDIKFAFISICPPKDKFQTLMSLFAATIVRMNRRTAKELKWPCVATPKCLTLNRPHPSSKEGFRCGPSTIIELTAVPWR